MEQDNLDNGIVVYCTKGNVMFNSSGELVQNVKKVRRNKTSRITSHHAFLNMLEYTDSEFWIKILTRCSKNNFPRNFSYSNHLLTFKFKSRRQHSSVHIDEKNLKQTFLNLQEFFRERGILPYEEKVEITCQQKENVIYKWKDLGKNQNNLVYEYADKLKQLYNLTEKEKNNLISAIKIGISGDIFNENTIILENNKIKNIEFLLWDENKRIFSIDKKFYNSKNYKKFKQQSVSKTYSSFKLNSSSEDKDLNQVEFSKFDVEKNWKKFLTSYYKI